MNPMSAPCGAREASERAITASEEEHSDRAKPAAIMSASAPGAGRPASREDTGQNTCAAVEAATPPSR